MQSAAVWTGNYCLGLELDHSGFDFSVLSEFRDRMAEDDRADRLLALMVDRLVEAGLVKRRGRQRTDSTHILVAVRRLDCLELVGETLRAALEELTGADEEWVSGLVTDEWARRHGRAVRYDRLRTLPQVEVLWQVWVQQYWQNEEGSLGWRGPKQTRDRQSRRQSPRRSTSAAAAAGSPAPATARVAWSSVEIASPHDPQARFSHKPGKAEWVGYKDHQTESCDTVLPNAIVHVATTPAPEQDIDTLEQIHAGLAARDLAPAEHLVDGGYTRAAQTAKSRTAKRVPGFTASQVSISCWVTSRRNSPCAAIGFRNSVARLMRA
ncbi:hypothetical protein ACFWWA_34275 [Streptomyces goshikiensis]|uniref:hypothetical protein n=1 Tax=Streptomyces goshikiensis TaxID=1942 RepID=UPI00365728A8